MKIVDLDEIFERSVRRYMQKNAGKYTEEEWEDKIAELYEAFGNAPLKELDGASPNAYFSSLSPKELCEALVAYNESGIEPPDLLTVAIAAADTEEELLKLVSPREENGVTAYALNILKIKGSTAPLSQYIKYVASPDTDEDLREIMGEILIENARLIKGELLAAAPTAEAGKDVFFKALSLCPQDQAVYDYLINEFKNAPVHVAAFYAGMLADYGDERAIEAITARINDGEINYADFVEFKLAIEALGGTYEDDRDFSYDDTYIKKKNYS